MKILLLTHMYANPDRSDLGNHLPALQVFAQWWTQAGHDVTVLQLYRHYGRDARVRVPLYGSRVARYEVDGVPVIRIECRYVARLSALTEPYFRRLARRAKALLPAGVDVMLVHFPMALAGFADSLDAGCPRVMTLHSTDIERLAAPGGRACFQRLRGAYRALGFRADPIRRQFYDLAAWDGPTLMVRSGAPIPTVEPALPTEGPLRVVFAGTLSERKRVEMLVRAMLRLPDRIDWTLRIAGDGPKRELIEQLAASPEANGRITLLGHLPREQVLAEMARGEVFAMVSAAETLGLVYLEAMACGMVTIGTRGLGIDGIIRDGENGFLADGDEDGLVALLTRIADMPRPARHAIARRAMETALSLTEEQAAADYLAQVRRAIDGGEQGG